MKPITLWLSDAGGIGNAKNTSFSRRFVVNDLAQFREAVIYDVMFSAMKFHVRAEANFQ